MTDRRNSNGTPTVGSMASPLMTAREIADYLQIEVSSAYKIMKGPLAKHALRVTAGGKGLRVQRQGFIEWVNEQTGKAVPPITGRGLRSVR